jgi:HEAT repeat protein
MTRTRPLLCALLLALALAASQWASADVQAVLDGIQAGDAASRQQLNQQLVELGAGGVLELAGMLVDPGTGDDTKPRMALHGMAVYLARPGAEQERRVFAQAMANAIAGTRSTEIRAFLIRQLQLAGGPESVEVLGGLLKDPALSGTAAQALLAASPEGAAAAFRAALPGAGAEAKPAIIEGLGALRDAEAVPALLPLAAEADTSVRLSALWALAQIGDPAAMDVLKGALTAESPFVRAKADAYYTDYLVRLAEEGHREQAEQACRALMEERGGDEYMRAACLTALGSILGPDVFDDLLAAMQDERVQIRNTARELAVGLPGRAVTRRWVTEMAGRPPQVRVEILRILGERRDAAALPAVVQAAADADEQVRVAALGALGDLGTDDAVPPLVAALRAGSQEERDAARGSLSKVPGDAPLLALQEAYNEADAAGRVEIVRGLAVRGGDALPALYKAAVDPEERVRVEAYRAIGAINGPIEPVVRLLAGVTGSRERSAAENALLETCRRTRDTEARAEPLIRAMERADSPFRASLIRVLGPLGGDAAFRVVRASLEDGNAEVHDAAVRALSGWPDPTPRDALIALARNEPKLVHRVLALRGYVRMVGDDKGLTADRALAMYRDAMGAVDNADARKLVLAGVGKVASPDALDYAQGYLQDETLEREAEAACLGIARALSGSHRERAMAVLTQIAEGSDSDTLRNQAADVLRRLEQVKDYITAWMMSGPYTERGKRGPDLFDIEFAPEQADGKAEWRPVPAFSRPDAPQVIDLNTILGGDNRAAYLRSVITVPAAQKALLAVGSDDGIKVWLNGEVVHANNASRGLTPDQDKVDVDLRAGENVLMMKITEGGGDWAATARLTRPDGASIPGMTARN